MVLVQGLVIGGSAVVAALATRVGWRDRRLIAFLASLVALIALDRAAHRGSPPPTSRARLAAADAAGNPYEALYAAMLWSAEEPRGGLELARRDRAMGLFRTCAEVTSQLLTAPEVADEARALHDECLSARTHHP